jgi:hypothetical protein
MARRGTFGRYNRSQPTQGIADTIMAIAREMAAKRESNLTDAWQNGGLFEGKPVTDDMILAYWKEKMAGVSKDDPSYDSYNNAYMQLDFRINLGKVETRYAQGKATEQQVAQFYLTWAKKIPKDSNFYRELQQKAAQFMESWKAKGKAAAKKAAEDAYYAAQKNLDGKRTVVDLVEQLGGPVRFMTLIEQGKAHPNDVLGEVDGHPVTGKSLMAELMKRDPSLKLETTTVTPASPRGSPDQPGRSVTSVSGGVTTDWLRGAYRNDHDISLKQADLATSAGKPSEAKAYAARAASTSEVASQLRIWGVSDPYSQIIAERDRVLKDPTSTGDDKAAALTAAGNKLVNLAGSADIDRTSSDLIRNEGLSNLGSEDADASLPSFGENYLGAKPSSKEGSAGVNQDTGETITVGANQSLFRLSAILAQEREAYDSDPEVGYTRAYGKRVDGVFVFDPSGKGTELGVVSALEIERSGAMVTSVMVEQENGPPVLVSVVGHPINTVARDGDGNEIPAGRLEKDGTVTTIKNPSVGWIFKYTGAGGREIRKYYTTDAAGGPVWTQSFPGYEGASELDNTDGSTTIEVSGALAPGALYYDPRTAATSPVTDIAGRSTNHAHTSLLSSAADAENPGAVVNAIVSTPAYAARLASQEQDAVTGATSLEAIQNDTTRIASGLVSPGDASEPVWTLGDHGNLISRKSATVGDRPIPDDGSLASLRAASDAYANRWDVGRKWEVSRSPDIRGVTSLRLPEAPKPKMVPNPAAPAPATLVAAREAMLPKPVDVPASAAPKVSPSVGFVIPKILPAQPGRQLPSLYPRIR